MELKTINWSQYRLRNCSRLNFRSAITAADNPKSEKTLVNPNTKVRMATIPKASLVRNRAKMASLSIWDAPTVMVDSVVHPNPKRIVFLLAFSLTSLRISNAAIKHVYHLIACPKKRNTICPPSITHILVVFK